MIFKLDDYEASTNLDAVPEADYYARSSDLTTVLNCSQEAQYSRIDDRVPLHMGPAVDIGNLYHRARELQAQGVPSPEIKSEIVSAANAAYEETYDKDTRYFARDFEYVLPLMQEHYSRDVNLIGTEVKFWLKLPRPVSFLAGCHMVVFGTFDSVFEYDGKVYVGEIKTVGTSTHVGQFLDMRRSTIQHMVYNLAGKVFYGAQFGGIRYEIFKRNPRPQKASGGKSLEERLEEWPSTLFSEEMLPPEDTSRTLMDTAIAACHRLYDAPPIRNTRACMAFGRPSCRYFKVCHEGYPLNGIDFTNREPDYVDAAWPTFTTKE